MNSHSAARPGAKVFRAATARAVAQRWPPSMGSRARTFHSAGESCQAPSKACSSTSSWSQAFCLAGSKAVQAFFAASGAISMSASAIISSISASVSASPRLDITCRRSWTERKPVPSSKARKASISSSSLSVSLILRAFKQRKSAKSMVPLPSASTSFTMSCSSASVGFCPKDRITDPRFLTEIVPGPPGLLGFQQFAEMVEVEGSSRCCSASTAMKDVSLVTT
mmetsp:Transcript_49031/g.116712  ORF Transcript_49031/g.116712 Transcript_49031/m.116712 type:complete len:224 (-) Transcript_49031:1765-2436(-)